MALKFDPYQFPTAPAYVKPKNVAEAFAESAPLYEKAIKGVEEYQARQERQKLFNDAMAGDKKGYEWYDSEDPAHKALVEQYIRTGDASGIANQRNNWQLSQERIAEKARTDEAIKKNNDKLEAAAAAAEKKAADAKAYETKWSKAKYDFRNALTEIENDKTKGFDKERAMVELIDKLLIQGFDEKDVYDFLNERNDLREMYGNAVSRNTTEHKKTEPKPKVTIRKK